MLKTATNDRCRAGAEIIRLMSGHVEIGEADPNEYPSISAMHYAVWRDSYSAMLPDADLDKFSPTDWADTVYPDLVRNGRTILVAKSGNEPVGVLIFGPDPLVPEHLEIEALYIASESQSQGIGSSLMKKALVRRPSPRVIVACAKENWSARKYYQHFGFKRDDARGRERFWEPDNAPDVKVSLVWLAQEHDLLKTLRGPR